MTSSPRPRSSELAYSRRRALRCLLFAGGAVMTQGGCSLLSKSRDETEASQDHLNKLMQAPEPPDLVRQAANSNGLTYVSVEGVAAINGLPGTGGPVGPSVYRDQLIEEMKRYDVVDPNGFLEQKKTALVRVQAVIPPGARRGDRVDLRIISPPKSEAVDLHGGWVMETRLRQQQVLAGSIRKSDVMVVGTGPTLVRAAHEAGNDPDLKLNGAVLGGGRVQQDRKLGLVIRPEYRHVKLAAQLASVINNRFYFFDGSSRSGIARALEDDFVEVVVHPRYRRNIHRQMAVVGGIAARGESSKTQLRLIDLGKRIAEPTTASDAAIQLEAIGDGAIPTLLEALKSSNKEIRFYAAESLAYLDRSEAIDPLIESIRQEPAFRYPGLIALEGLDTRGALEALQRLCDESSIETRYGALRAIRRRPDGEMAFRGDAMGGALRYYEVPSGGPPFVAVSLSETPEIACFGNDLQIRIPDFLFGPGGFVIRPDESEPHKIRVTRFQPGADDGRVVVPSTVQGLLTGITTAGGGFGDCVAILKAAKSKNYLECGLAMDPLPKSMRTYHREDTVELSDPAALPPTDIQPPPSKKQKAWWSPW